MSHDKRGRDSDLRQRTQEVFQGGKRCVDCFVELVGEQGVGLPSQVVELAPVLQKFLGGSGAVCSVFATSVLARALDEDQAPTGADAPIAQTVPVQDWLDAFAPHSAESPGVQKYSKLAGQLSDFAIQRYGGTDCTSITGVDWQPSRAVAAGLYFSGGGAERCMDFITEIAQAYAASVDAGATEQ